MRIYLLIRELTDNDLGRQTKVLSAYKDMIKAHDDKQKWLKFFNAADRVKAHRVKALNVLNTTVRLYVESIEVIE